MKQENEEKVVSNIPVTSLEGEDDSSENSAKEKDDQEEQEIAEIVREMPKTARKQFGMLFAQRSSGPMPHPLFDKFTKDHIDKFLDYSQQDDNNQYKFHSSNRWLNQERPVGRKGAPF